MVAGGVLLGAGALIWLLGRLKWLGNLPGDIRIQGTGFSCFVPLASILILSVAVTIVLNVIIRLLK